MYTLSENPTFEECLLSPTPLEKKEKKKIENVQMRGLRGAHGRPLERRASHNIDRINLQFRHEPRNQQRRRRRRGMERLGRAREMGVHLAATAAQLLSPG